MKNNKTLNFHVIQSRISEIYFFTTLIHNTATNAFKQKKISTL